MPAERKRRQHMRRDVRKHARAVVGDQRDARDGRRNARGEPRREVREGFDSDVRRVARVERIERGTDHCVISRRRGVAEHAQLVAERPPCRRIDGAVDRA